MLNVRILGAKGDGVTDETATFQYALRTGNVVYVPPGTYRITQPLSVPSATSIVGAGMNAAVLLCDGVSGLLHESPPESYEQAGRVQEIWFQGRAGAAVGLTADYRQHLLLDRVRFSGFSRQSVLLRHTLMSTLRECLIQGGGNQDVASVEVQNSTCFLWEHSRISGGNPNCCAGLRLDGVVPFELRGGCLESCGCCLQIACNPDVKVRSGPGVVSCMDLENPVGRYVQTGLGWKGTPGTAVKEVTFANCTLTTSRSRSATRGFLLANTWACRVEHCNVGTLPGGAEIELLETNLAFSLGINGTPDASQKYLLRDGVEDLAAVRQKPYP